ncbi:SIR2 family protein [Acinetobacter lanii]|uniref:Uncharacterized protein n=1 Tax=Acinetobacter lanii TaxID=2715163 RepID=A0A6G8S577_9GAMM|nr:SIR2 family protein [Acinetobacter lanii]QIO09386.1 hypothetical protein G8D99_10380 [Acinetobacter lanii]
MATMKFKDLVEKELQNKKRSVKDLVNYVGKTPMSHPNYSIFLGAGASVTSGINSGGHLVHNWRKEIYEQYCGDYYSKNIEHNAELLNEDDAKDRAINYLIREQGHWYNPQNEYSSLFERKFDLPSQRRRFVESLVDEKLPSIGYLHLITLINNSYFNTIFTTNFDDLINEAFYQFSNTRPLICAHDSAVGSVSVISKRPKIIKLHGDYLYDDIKNTIKETESLEQNIKEKFIEFTKDNGLIIVGYSGQDRSILDVLNYLLQQEEYLKNGLYWCFRADDEINHEVRKILWRDKVYCVEIDGFDELFTEFCHHVNVKPNLIDSATDSKREKCIKKFITDYETSDIKNILIKDFIEEVSTARNNQNISDLIRQLNENTNSHISQENFKNLLEVEQLISKLDYDKALEKINFELKNINDKEIEESYISLKIRVLKLQKKDRLAIEIIENLIESDPYNPKFYQWKLNFINNIEERINYLFDVNNKIINNQHFKNLLVEAFIYNLENDEIKNNVEFEYCEKLINESIQIYPSLDNDAYELKYKLLNIKINKQLFKDKIQKNKIEHELKINSEISKIIETITSINKFNINAINLKKEYIMDKKNITLINDFISDLESYISKSHNDKAKKIIGIISSIYLKLTTTNIASFKDSDKINYSKIDDFFFNYADDFTKEDNFKFLLNKFNYFYSRNLDLDNLESDLNQILALKDSLEYIKLTVSNFTSFSIKNINETLKKFIEEKKKIIKIEDYYYCLSEIEKSNKNFNDALSLLHKSYSSSEKDLNGSEIISYTYALLLAEKYEDLDKFISKSSNIIKKIEKDDRLIIEINTLVAKKLNSFLTETDKAILQTYLSKHSNNKRVFICINSLLEKNNEALFHIKEQINLDYRAYYEFKEWPSINKIIKLEMEKYYNTLSNTNLVNIA